MKQKVVIDKSFDNLSKEQIPEDFADLVHLCYESKFKIEFANNKVLENVIVIKDVILYETGKVGIVTGINEVKIIACNRSAEQMWQVVCGLMK